MSTPDNTTDPGDGFDLGPGALGPGAIEHFHDGRTLRDEFALAALGPLVANYGELGAALGAAAYRIADQAMAAREAPAASETR